LFDGMADEYDDVTDLWYSWLFCRLHYFLVFGLIRSGLGPGARCLDVGCGTGFQSVLLNLCGHDVIGIDLAAALLAKATNKKAEAYLSRDFFNAPFPFVPRYSKKIRSLALQYRCTSKLGKSEFKVASATAIPFPDSSFDLVNCCGSTLSFIEDYDKAIREMARTLKPGGILFIEVENKYNVDLVWPVLDAKFFGGRLGYDQPLETVKANLFSRRLENVKIEYPFSGKQGEIDMPIWLFSAPRLLRDIQKTGFQVKSIHSVHSVTNLIPSVSLDKAVPSQKSMRLFGMLSAIEEIVASWPVFRRLGCSLILTAIKK